MTNTPQNTTTTQDNKHITIFFDDDRLWACHITEDLPLTHKLINKYGCVLDEEINAVTLRVY